MSEVVLNNKTGLLTHNLDERMQAVKSLSTNQELRLKMGQEAQIFSRNEFNLDKFVKSHIDVYREVFAEINS